jgi:hypothetical protein
MVARSFARVAGLLVVLAAGCTAIFEAATSDLDETEAGATANGPGGPGNGSGAGATNGAGAGTVGPGAGTSNTGGTPTTSAGGGGGAPPCECIPTVAGATHVRAVVGDASCGQWKKLQRAEPVQPGCSCDDCTLPPTSCEATLYMQLNCGDNSKNGTKLVPEGCLDDTKMFVMGEGKTPDIITEASAGDNAYKVTPGVPGTPTAPMSGQKNPLTLFTVCEAPSTTVCPASAEQVCVPPLPGVDVACILVDGSSCPPNTWPLPVAAISKDNRNCSTCECTLPPPGCSKKIDVYDDPNCQGALKATFSSTSCAPNPPLLGNVNGALWLQPSAPTKATVKNPGEVVFESPQMLCCNVKLLP